jgi:UDP-N-acetylmuramate--alanine ligase
MIDLNKINKIYFVGIGGIGISAVAGIAHVRNFIVEGSDASAGEIVNDLREHRIKVNVPHDAIHIDESISLVVYSVAVPDDNVEIVRAQELNIPLISYPQFLGLLIQDKFGIGISGTDGKTTTTAMIAKILIDAGLDPSVVLGAKAEFLEDNWRVGESQYFVFESDEYRRAFDNYNPRIAVVTNIGADHLDYYKDEADYLSAFKNYLGRIDEAGFIIINNDNPRSIEAGLNTKAKKITYSLEADSDFQATGLKLGDGYQSFIVGGQEYKIKLPGNYNVYNALSAIAVARTLGIEEPVIANSLSSFGGLWRRFQSLGQCGQTEVIADYAHTPDAVAKVIEAVNNFYPQKKVLVVFQPHQYGRTKNLFTEFVQAFDGAKKVLLPDIFYVKGRENPADFSVSSQLLAEEVSKRGVDIEATGSLKESEEKVREVIKDFEVILVLGAGDVYELAKNLVK